MPKYILILTACVSLLAVYVSLLAGRRKKLDAYLRFFLGYLALHAIHAWIVRMYFPDNMRLDYYAPYGLSYGPFLYFAYRVASDQAISKRSILLHELPFLVYLGCYFLWIVFPGLFGDHLRVFGLSLYGTLSLSLISYTVWALFFRPTSGPDTRNEEIRMISVMAIILAFTAAVFLVFTYTTIISGPVRSQFKGSVVYLTMLCAALISFSYIVQSIITSDAKATTADEANPEGENESMALPSTPALSPAEPTERYQKSAIAPELLAAYELEVRRVVEEQQGYLNEELSSESLAQQLRIPKHHLSQVFSIRIGKTFNSYVNEHRVRHAVALMHNHPDMSITDIYTSSGFIAKASFNRYFKELHGCTPSEYRSRIR